MDLFAHVRAALSDRYDVEREIGEGGMARVYLARDLRLDRRVAIKVLRPEISVSLGTDRFVREIEIASKLQHPHVIPLHDVGEAEGLLYYVMPYVEGESLRARLNREGLLELREAVRIAGEVAAALYYAHGQGIIHRDIKPGNILLSSGHAQVADFGIARALNAARHEGRTEPGVVVGTPEYMSPEQASGSEEVDARSDQYSLACMLFEVLAGKAPFAAEGREQVLTEILTGPPPSVRSLRPKMPEALDRALRRALARSPADRFPSVREFADAVFAAVERTSRPAIVAARLAWLAAAVAVVLSVAWVVRTLLPPPRDASPGVLRLAVVPAPDGAEAGDPLAGLVRTHLAVFENVVADDATDLLDPGGRTRLRDLVRSAWGEGYDYVMQVGRVGSGPSAAIALSAVHAGTGDPAYSHVLPVGDAAGQAAASLALAALQAIAERDSIDVGVRLDALTASPFGEAIAALVQARRRLLRGDENGAAAALDSAIAEDPEFLLPYSRRAIVEEWSHRWPREGAAIVRRGLERSGRRGTQWIPLLEAQRYFSLSIVDSARNAFHLLVRDAPNDPDAWLGYAEALFHFGPYMGSTPDDARVALERAAALGAGYPTILQHLTELALQRADSQAARSYLDRLNRAGMTDAVREAAFALQFGGGAGRQDAMQRLQDHVRTVVSDAVVHLALGLGEVVLADSVARLLTDARRVPEDRIRGAQYRLVLLAAQGDWSGAAEAWEADADLGAFDEWMVAAYLAGHPAAQWAEPMLAEAWREARAGTAPNFAEEQFAHIRSRFRSVVHWTTLHGDSVQAELLLGAIARGRRTAYDADPLPAVLQASLGSRLALLSADTASAIALLERAVTRPVWHLLAYYPTISMAPQRMLLAELLASKGDQQGAAHWLNSFTEIGALGDLAYADRVARLRRSLSP